MTVLPVAVAPAAGWSLVDITTAAAVSPAAAGGEATATFAQLPADEMWLVDHAVVYCTSVAETEVRWYQGAVQPSALLDGSSSGNFDVADWPAGLRVGASDQLVVQWAGADDGAKGTVRIQYRLYRRS